MDNQNNGLAKTRSFHILLHVPGKKPIDWWLEIMPRAGEFVRFEEEEYVVGRILHYLTPGPFQVIQIHLLPAENEPVE